LDRGRRAAALRPEQGRDGGSTAVPWPEMAISRYRTLPRERNTPAGRAYQCELTMSGNKADEEPRVACGLERQTVRAMARVWPPQDDVGPPLRCKMERRGATSGFYSPVVL
jgi:hypothetical protein